jgi:hypothetical protein
MVRARNRNVRRVDAVTGDEDSSSNATEHHRNEAGSVDGGGNDDMLGSLDLHDVLVLIDGREELIAEIDQEPVLSHYISNELAALRSNPYFSYLTESALHGYGALIAQRAREVHRRIEAIIACAAS